MAEKVYLVGDLCLGMEIEAKILGEPEYDLWAGIRPLLNYEEDILIANLESALTDCDTAKPFKWATLRARPQCVSALPPLKIAVLGNNHISDFGNVGVTDTIENLNQSGISVVGYGEDVTSSLRPAIVSSGGQRLGIVSLCCPTTNSQSLATHTTPGSAPLGMETLKKSIEAARPLTDALIAYLHWGCEQSHDPSPDQLRLARQAIDCGVDAVVGCHSHTIQSFEQYRGRWIFYGLGNYLFSSGYGTRFDKDGLRECVPLRFEQPNRESLVVSFNIVPESETGRLDIDSIQPVCFDDGFIPRPITTSELSFDLDASNKRLQQYVLSNAKELSARHEPCYRAQLKNGVLAFWYRKESIIETSETHDQGVCNRLKQLVSKGLSKLC